MKARGKDIDIAAVDLFCGVGGLTHGLVRGGIRVIAGVDVDEACKFPYEANNPATFLADDVKTISARSISDLLQGSKLSLLAGCAPCQPFSTYSQVGRKQRGSSDWSLVASFGKLIRKVSPDFVTMENVPQVEHHEVFKVFLRDLKGYHVSWDTIDCSTVGVPQTRKRLVLLASKLGPEGLTLTANEPQSATVKDAIAHLPPLSAGGTDDEDPLHLACRLSPLNLKRIVHLYRAARAPLKPSFASGVPSTRDRRYVPECLWPHGMGRSIAHNHYAMFRIRQWQIRTSGAGPSHHFARSRDAANVPVGLRLCEKGRAI